MKSRLLALSLSVCTVAALASSGQARAGEAFGTYSGASIFVDAAQFHPISDPTCGMMIQGEGLYFKSGCASGQVYYATFSLPEGAMVGYLYSFYKDNDAGASLTSELVRFNAKYGGGDTPNTSYNFASTQFTSGDSTLPQMTSQYPDFTYDTYDQSSTINSVYGIRLAMPGSAANVSYHGMWILYTRQLAPAPAVATFSDVPTTHPFYAYVSQLAKSGITSGCGGGNFCPDAPVTRGQMAVFLSKALGLQWDLATSAP
jgi:S-layer family protein